MTLVGIVLLGFMNRRPLLITGFSGVAASQAALALCFLLPESTLRSYLVLAFMVSFVGFVQCFIGIGVWLLLSEIFPMAIRGFAMGIAVFVLWTVNATISQVFPQLVEAAGATRHVRPLRPDQHRVDRVRRPLRARDPRPHARGARGRVPRARRQGRPRPATSSPSHAS